MAYVISFMYVFSFVTVCQNKMQVDQEDQKLQAGDNGDKKSETEEMEVTLCWAIRQSLRNIFMILYIAESHCFLQTARQGAT